MRATAGLAWLVDDTRFGQRDAANNGPGGAADRVNPPFPIGDRYRARELAEAAEFFIARRDTNLFPPGDEGDGEPWWLGDMARERQVCCEGIDTFSRHFIEHCRTYRHVAALCGVDARELREYVRRLDRRRETNRPCYVKEM